MEIKYLDAKRIRGSSTGANTATAGTVSSNITLNFTGTGTFTPTSNTTVQYVAVAGGGGGGKDAYSGARCAGGGGAGAYRESSFTAVADTTYTLTIGAGGTGGTSTTASSVVGANGGDTTITGSGLTTITSSGGSGGGGHDAGGDNYVGNANGNASGGGGSNGKSGGVGGTYGYAGGSGAGGSASGGGGGGASTVGVDGHTGGTGGNGGAGSTPSATYFSSSVLAGGGGGNTVGATQGTGGSSIGGNASASGTVGGAGTVNTGSGGGATRSADGGAGGTGVILLSFSNSVAYATTAGGVGTTDDKTTLVTAAEADGYAISDGSDYAYTGGDSRPYYKFLHDGSENSIAFWIYRDGNQAQEAMVCTTSDNSNASGHQGASVYFMNDNNIHYLISNGDGINAPFTSTGVSITDQTWTHIACTLSESSGTYTMRIYKNGVNTNTTGTDTQTFTYTPTTSDSWTSLNVFRNAGSSSNKVDGRVADMGFWDNHVLSDDDIDKLSGTNGQSVTRITDDGTGFDYSTSNIVDHYPLFTGITDTKNATYNLTNAGLTFGTTSAPTAISAFSNLPENTLFEETDTYKTYWLQSGEWIWGGRPPVWSSLVNWFDASDLSSITKDGSNRVSQWNDGKGSDNLVQATGGDQPLWTDADQNGKAVIDFVSSRGMANSASSTAQPQTYFAALVPPTTGSGTKRPWTSGSQQVYTSGSANHWGLYAGSEPTFDTDIGSGFQIWEITFNGSSSSWKVNNISKLTGDVGSGTAGALILADHYDNYANNKVGEWLRYDGTLTSAEKTSIYNYLKDKWGL